MGNRKVHFVEGEFYHIYSRGNSKQKIFLDDFDRDRFVKLLYLCNSKININFRDDIVRQNIEAFDFDRGKPIVCIGAWVLMSNHFHIYLSMNNSPKLDLGENKNGVTEFMRKFLTSYSKYFNKKYKRTGGLFEGKFQSVHIDKDNQAKYLFSYIHLNPLKLINKNWKTEGIGNLKDTKKFLTEYKWSSYLDHTKNNRPENKILNLENFPQYFKTIKDFETETEDWFKIEDTELAEVGLPQENKNSL